MQMNEDKAGKVLCVYTFIGNVVFFMSHIALFLELIITDTNLVVARKMRYKQDITADLTFSQQCWSRLAGYHAMPTGKFLPNFRKSTAPSFSFSSRPGHLLDC